jgi:hypothetical protein
MKELNNYVTVSIEEGPSGTVCHIPDSMTPDQLGLLIQAASHNLKCKQVELGEAKDQVGNTASPAFHQFETGARRSEKIEARYDLIPEGPLRRLALRYGLGAKNYGDNNWKKGLPFSDVYNHIIDHLNHVKAAIESGVDLTDDELAGAAWGTFALMFFQDRGDYSKDVPVQSLEPNEKEREFLKTRQVYHDALNRIQKAATTPDPRA